MNIKDYLGLVLFIGYVLFCHFFVDIETVGYTDPISLLLLKMLFFPFGMIVFIAVMLIIAIKLLIGF